MRVRFLGPQKPMMSCARRATISVEGRRGPPTCYAPRVAVIKIVFSRPSACRSTMVAKATPQTPPCPLVLLRSQDPGAVRRASTWSASLIISLPVKLAPMLTRPWLLQIRVRLLATDAAELGMRWWRTGRPRGSILEAVRAPEGREGPEDLSRPGAEPSSGGRARPPADREGAGRARPRRAGQDRDGDQQHRPQRGCDAVGHAWRRSTAMPACRTTPSR